jgi:hypothetical protein
VEVWELGDQAAGGAQVRCAHVGPEDRKQGGGVSEQQALAPVQPEQIGVSVSWCGGLAQAKDGQHHLRAPQDRQPIIGAGGAPDARQKTAADRAASGISDRDSVHI